MRKVTQDRGAGREIERRSVGKKITAVFGKHLGSDLVPKYENHVVIEPEHATYHSDRCNIYAPETVGHLRHVFEHMDIPDALNAEYVKSRGFGFRTTAGFIDLAIKLMAQGVPVVLRHPETGLHPSCAAQLADVLITLSTKGPE